jgi:ribosomal protein S18 acetylase RimI-like enzyme
MPSTFSTLRALLNRIVGRRYLRIMADSWDPRVGGQLRATVNGVIAGHLKTRIQLEAPHDDNAPAGLCGPVYVHFADCWIAPEFRARGIGTILVVEAFALMKLNLPAETVIFGWVRSTEMDRATRFWESFGFKMEVNPTRGNTVMCVVLSGAKVPVFEKTRAWANASAVRSKN